MGQRMFDTASDSAWHKELVPSSDNPSTRPRAPKTMVCLGCQQGPCLVWLPVPGDIGSRAIQRSQFCPSYSSGLEEAPRLGFPICEMWMVGPGHVPLRVQGSCSP